MQMLFFFTKRKSASTFCGIYFIVTLFSGDQHRSLKEAFACCLVQAASELKEEIERGQCLEAGAAWFWWVVGGAVQPDSSYHSLAVQR